MKTVEQLMAIYEPMLAEPATAHEAIRECRSISMQCDVVDYESMENTLAMGYLRGIRNVVVDYIITIDRTGDKTPVTIRELKSRKMKVL